MARMLSDAQFVGLEILKNLKSLLASAAVRREVIPNNVCKHCKRLVVWIEVCMESMTY